MNNVIDLTQKLKEDKIAGLIADLWIISMSNGSVEIGEKFSYFASKAVTIGINDKDLKELEALLNTLKP